MNTRTLWVFLIVSFVVICGLTWLLLATPAPEEQQQNTDTQATTTATQPLALHDRVTVTAPQKNATVGSTFTVAGTAPGPWFFEASFPVQVRDKDNNKIGQAIAQAQGDWMTEGLVTFTASVTLSGSYKGPATLVLLKDNPSGLPENEDAVEIPIVIQ